MVDCRFRTYLLYWYSKDYKQGRISSSWFDFYSCLVHCNLKFDFRFWPFKLFCDNRTESLIITRHANFAANRLRRIFIGMINYVPASQQQVPLSSYPLCAYREEPIGSGETFNFVCNQVLSGRYLIIQLNHSDPLTLCEVEVNEGNNQS